MGYLMGVDIGTSSVKAVLFRQSGEMRARHAVDYTLYTDPSGKAEQDPEEILQATVTAIQTVMQEIRPEQLEAVSFSAAMHSLILFDEKNNPLTACLTWADQRSNETLAKLKQMYDLHPLYEKTGTPLHPMSPFAKLCWLHEDCPELMARAAKIGGIKSFLIYRLFGDWLIDESLASGSGLYNLESHTWEPFALELAHVDPTMLPKVVPETTILNHLSPKWAERLGVRPDTPFVVGASDGALANLGIQAIRPHDVTVTVGTSGAVRKIRTHYQADPYERTFCYGVTKELFITGGAVNGGGKIVEWALQQFGTAAERQTDNFAAFIKRAASAPAGAAGLLFHPYLLGERAPYWDTNLRGGFIGLSVNHKEAHLIRAVLEGIALNLASIYESIAEEEDIVYVSGGISAHDFWCQLLANIFDREVRVPHTIEGSSLGAVILAMQALHLIDEPRLPGLPVIAKVFQPEPAHVETYRELHEIFKESTAQLATTYHKLAKWQSGLVK
ncbi:gluconokinase [Listeria costaricensis]|uniref:gluconokinase n=1 Tax=Listeria costaricensis TaxID=2026604 RepID=UPI001F08F675|nr:gluconokinase [Listeria costaricensis]